MRRSILILCLVLCLITFWLLRMAFQAETPAPAPPIVSPARANLSTPTPRKAERTPKARPLLKIATKGNVRLKPGESAVLGYWEIAAGMNGMAIVTPETTPEGHVKLTTNLVQIHEDAVSELEAQDLFPDFFNFENFSAIGTDRLLELQASMQKTRRVDLLSIPTVVSHPGQQASISIGNSNEAMLFLGLQADPVAEDGGFDLSLDFRRQE